MIEVHDLHHEFPDQHARIDALRRADAEFSGKVDRYDSLDREIRKVEDGDAVMTDFELEALKKRRLAMKDELYAVLKRASP